ncbi:MAG TPA: ATP-binding cassette domain-containing protein [Roseiflexaceae bacterium]|nr:ATP-binding cassette domain-containing protein [Roseiflexaceae bacterium]
MGEPIIELQGVSKHYRVLERGPGVAGFLRGLVRPRWRSITALRAIDLRIDAGSIVGYIGPNGAGKSTTIKIVAGVLRPSSGLVRVAGRDPQQQRIAHQLELGVVLGQRSQLLWDLPVRESLLYHGRVYRIPAPDLARRTDELVALFGIVDLLDQPVRQLSLGQRMRCNLALNLLHRPRVLLLDEPTIGLDFDARDSLREAVRTAAHTFGTTVLLTSHDLADVEALSDRLVILHQGGIIFSGTRRELFQQYRIHPTIHVSAAAETEQIRAWLLGVPGVEAVSQGEGACVIAYDEERTSPARITALLFQKTDLSDFSLHKPTIEDIVRSVYQRQGEPTAPVAS